MRFGREAMMPFTIAMDVDEIILNPIASAILKYKFKILR
jgi:hypothetical protein